MMHQNQYSVSTYALPLPSSSAAAAGMMQNLVQTQLREQIKKWFACWWVCTVWWGNAELAELLGAVWSEYCTQISNNKVNVSLFPPPPPFLPSAITILRAPMSRFVHKRPRITCRYSNIIIKLITAHIIWKILCMLRTYVRTYNRVLSVFSNEK